MYRQSCRYFSSSNFWQVQILSNVFQKIDVHLLIVELLYIVNVERFVGLNFHGFQEYCESFTVNIYFCI